jgi:hypothetical protein
MESVVVRDRVSALDRVETVEPAARVVDDHLWWELTLQPFETQWLRVELRPNDIGEVFSETEVTVVSRVGAITQVSDPPVVEEPSPAASIPDVEPSVAQEPSPMADPFPGFQPLPPRSSIPQPPQTEPAASPIVSMTWESSEAATVGREWSTVFMVTNTGDAPARGVAIEISLPRQLRHRHGTAIRHEIAQLAPGESRRARLIVIAEAPGRPEFSATLSHDQRVVQQEAIGLSISPAGEVEQTSFDRPARREEPVRCTPPLILLRPGCAW